MEKVTLTTQKQATQLQQVEQVDIPVISVEADPVITTYTEQQVDSQLQWAKQGLENANNNVITSQANLDKWQSYKDQFPAKQVTPVEIIK